MAALFEAPPAFAGPAGGGAEQPAAASAAVSKVAAKPPLRAQSETAGNAQLPPAVWPSAADGTVSLGTGTPTTTTAAAVAGVQATVGGLPVLVRTAINAEASPRTRGELAPVPVAHGPAAVRVTVAGQDAAAAAGIKGVLLTVARADGSTAASQVGLTVGYGRFAAAFGADYGARLGLVRLPACVLSTPQVPSCQVGTPIAARNDESARTVIAEQVPVSGTASVIALAAGSSTPGANWAATDLSQTYAWSAGTSGGDFNLNYPLKVPPSLGGPVPDLSFGYSAGSVDGQTYQAGGQSSMLGEGWSFQAGYVERSYRVCSEDGGTTADQCWFSRNNATLVFNGRATELVRDETTGVWHTSTDDGLRVELLVEGTGSALKNADDDGELWRVTTLDGTQYHFGRHKRYATDTAVTNSVLTHPVFGNNAGEPCYNAAGFGSSWCQQAYRWGLDYVVDPRGNSMTYFYSKLSGRYGLNNNASAQPYDLAGYLDRIEYGTRAGAEAASNAPAKVVFTNSERCFGTCVWPTTYADTPSDKYCDSAATSCPNTLGPVFFNRKRLTAVTTQVWNPVTSAYRKADTWDLQQTFLESGDYILPAGDDTAPNLWLSGLTHTGYAPDGTTALTEPQTTFGGVRKPNRVNWGDGIGVSPYMHWRVTTVNNGAGGQTEVVYTNEECVNGAAIPAGFTQNNTKRCFPQYFKPVIAPANWDWFHKYVVTDVIEHDLTGGGPDERTHYDYATEGSSTATLWHHDNAETVSMDYRSWSQWRGYPTVTTTKGPAGGTTNTVTVDRYFRGMHKDRLPSAQGGWGARTAYLTRPLDISGETAALVVAYGKCADVDQESSADGTKIQIWDCNDTAAQQWTWSAGDGTVRALGKCLDVAGAVNGSLTRLFTCGSPVAANQVWQPQADGSLKNPASGRCLDLPDGVLTNGTQLQIWDCAAVPAQQWKAGIADHEALDGVLYEHVTMNGTVAAAAEFHSQTVTQTATRNAPSVYSTTQKAFMARETISRKRTWINATSSWRWSQVDTTYDAFGLPTATRDRGDTAVTTDDACTQTAYARTNTATKYLIDYPSQVTATDCATSPGAANHLSGRQTYYDNQATHGAGPTSGLPTKTTVLASFSGSTPVWAPESKSGYDTYGRITSKRDALDRLSTTAYTPATGALVSSTTLTNPALHTATSKIDPARATPLETTDANARVVRTEYDPLGRLTKVFLPHGIGGGPTTSLPDYEFTYALSNTTPNVVTTKKLGPNGNQIASFELYDGRLRQRQSQAPGPQGNGGRIITDTAFDARGLSVKSTTFWNSTAPGGTLAGFADSDAAIKNQHRLTYDNQGRATADALYSANVLKWQTTSGYDGDRTWTVPPAGGIATLTRLNARGSTVEMRQYLTGAPPAGTGFQTTTYAYDRAERLLSTTDQAGNAWTSHYDLRGRVDSSTDPDKGTTTSVHDNAGQAVTVTDARSVSLTYTYDSLGRKTATYDGVGTGGFKRAGWTYDTLAKGQLTNSTRYVGSDAFTTTVTGYNDAYRPLGTTTVVPSSLALPGLPAGTYTVGTAYNIDDSVKSNTYPNAGGLAAETVTNTYDTTGRLLTVAGATTYVASTSYHNFGPVYQRVLGTGTKRVRQTTAVDEATGRLVTNKTEKENQTTPGTWVEVLTETLGYDAGGNVKSISETSGGTTVSNQCFGFDALRQMTQAWTTTAAACQATPSTAVVTGPNPYWSTYQYNTVSGNRTKEIRHVSSGTDTTRTYAYPATGKTHTLTGVTATGGTTGTDAYTYDATGNVKTRAIAGKPGQTLTWDSEGHLASVADSAGTTAYIYDAEGNRLVGTDPTGSTVYLAGFELRKVGSTVTCTRFYSGVGVRTAAGLSWVGADHHGSGQLTVNAADLTVTRRYLDPFGNVRGADPVWPGNRGFVDGVRDGTGLTHLGAREYEPATGRFVSVDPLLDIADPQQFGGYTYAGGNPSTFADPTGLCKICDALKKAKPADIKKIVKVVGHGPVTATSGLGTRVIVNPAGKEQRPDNSHDDYNPNPPFGVASEISKAAHLAAYNDVMATFCAFGPMICDLFHHYLDETGTAFHVSMQRLMNDPVFSSTISHEVAWLLTQATTTCTESGASTCTYGLDSRWQIARLDLSPNKEIHYGLGQILFRMQGKVELTLQEDGSYQAWGSMQLDVYKDWNFDDDDTVKPGKYVTAYFEDMPRLGLAREFPVYGRSMIWIDQQAW